MKIHILSDVHNEFSEFVPPPTDADVVVLAGDIHQGTDGIDWARRHFKAPVIYLAGNHEFYRHDMPEMMERLRERAAAACKGASVPAIHFLDGEAVVIGGVRFLGATLWTDFALYGDDSGAIEFAMFEASRGMNDFRVIRNGGGLFTPSDARELFQAAAKFLSKALAEPFAGRTVVVTHHAPSARSIMPQYEGDSLNPAFASNLESLMGAPKLWIHGHMHSSLDYEVNGTRVVCNPRGYTLRSGSRVPRDGSAAQENAHFDAGLVVEI